MSPGTDGSSSPLLSLAASSMSADKIGSGPAMSVEDKRVTGWPFNLKVMRGSNVRTTSTSASFLCQILSNNPFRKIESY